MSAVTFQKALAALMDQEYRRSLAHDPARLTNEFDLTESEKHLLITVGVAAGEPPDIASHHIAAPVPVPASPSATPARPAESRRREFPSHVVKLDLRGARTI